MFTISVTSNVKQVVYHLNRIGRTMGDQALVRTLNDVIAQSRTHMIRAITSEYNLTASTVRDRLRIERAKRKGMQFTATLIGNPAGRAKRAMNVIRFLEKSTSLAQARKRRKAGTLGDLYFKIRRKGGAKRIDGAFIGNRGRTVFRRVGNERLPIEPVQTIGVPQMFQAKKVQVPIQQWISTNFPRIFERHVRYFLSTVK